MNKKIILAILAVLIVAIAAFAMFSQQASTLTTASGKMNTELDILTDNTLSNGNQIQFQLKEKNGSAIAGEKVKIGFTNNNGALETFEVVTNSEGKGALVLENEAAGDHELTLAYDGNDKYNGCAIKLTITVADSSNDNSKAISDDNSANSNDPSQNHDLPDNPEHWNYDNETGQYYLDDGTIVGDSQWAGTSIYELRKLFEEGNGDPYANIS